MIVKISTISLWQVRGISPLSERNVPPRLRKPKTNVGRLRTQSNASLKVVKGSQNKSVSSTLDQPILPIRPIFQAILLHRRLQMQL